jgi:WD40 repeat protein
MITRIIARVACFLLIIFVTACTLPEITPPAQPTTETPPSFISNPTETLPTGSATPIIPQFITDKNISGLLATKKAALTNPQFIEWAQDGQTLSIATQNSDSAGNQLFGVTTLNSLDLSPKSIFSSKDNRVTAIARDGQTVAAISQDMNSVSLYDLINGNTVTSTITPGFHIGQVSFSPDLSYIAITQAEAWEVVIYSFVNPQEVRRLTGFETAAPVFDAGFANSPQWIAWHARGTLQLQEVETGKLGPSFSHEDFLSAFSLSPDGTILATVASKVVNNQSFPTLFLWDAAQGTELTAIILENPANAVTFSPDGKMLAAGIGNLLQVWRVSDGQLLGSFAGHNDQINAVAFSPDGKSLASTGFDNQLYLWQVP